MAKVKKKTNWDLVFCYYLRSRPIDWKNHGEPLCDPLDFVCVIASTDGYHTEDRGSWNVLCRRWICGVWTFCSAGRTSWGVNRTYTCSNSNNFTNHGRLRYSQGCRFSGKPYWRWPWVFQVIYIDTFILCIFFLFLDKSHIKEEVFHNGFFFFINTTKESYFREKLPKSTCWLGLLHGLTRCCLVLKDPYFLYTHATSMVLKLRGVSVQLLPARLKTGSQFLLTRIKQHFESSGCT